MSSPESPVVVRYELSPAGVATVTLDSPQTRNALSAGLVAQLHGHLSAASADPAVRVIVLTGTGTVFCAGADLKGSPGDSAMSLSDVILAITSSPKPVIARVNGKARAGGLGLIAACDLAVAPASADFAFTEVRIGVVPAVIAAVCLPLLDRRTAQELYLTGATFDATRAASIGLLTAAAPDDRLDAVVDEYVAALSLGGPNALAGTKTVLAGPSFRVVGEELPGLLAELGQLSKGYFASEEAREGMTAWRERRDPSWVSSQRL